MLEYTPPRGGPSNEAHKRLLEAHTFTPNTKHATYCSLREIPKSLRGDQKCTCYMSPTAKGLAKLRCDGVLVEPPHFPDNKRKDHALRTRSKPNGPPTSYHCNCGERYLAMRREQARVQHREHLKRVTG